MNGDALIYDVAVSFAGAQRDEVEPLVRACQQLGVKVFYDKDKTVEFWGEHFHYGMRDIYGGAHARYFMPFLSKEYLASPYPMDEFHAGALHALEIMGGNYILPIMVGDVQVPSRLLSPSIGYLMLENYTTDELAAIIAKKVGVTAAEKKPLRMPRIPTVDFSPRKELEAARTRIGALFQQHSGSLIPYGVQCTVRSGMVLIVEVERAGHLICSIEVQCSDVQLVVSFSRSRNLEISIVTVAWDQGARRPALRLAQLKVPYPNKIVTADELFDLLWDEIIDHLERG